MRVIRVVVGGEHRNDAPLPVVFFRVARLPVLRGEELVYYGRFPSRFTTNR